MCFFNRPERLLFGISGLILIAVMIVIMFVIGPFLPLLMPAFLFPFMPAFFFPLPVRDVPLPPEALPVIPWDPDYRAGDIAALNYRPWPVVRSGAVPAVPARRPPVAAEEEYVDPGLGHEVDLGTRDSDHFRRRSDNYRRGADIDVHIYSRQHLFGPDE